MTGVAGFVYQPHKVRAEQQEIWERLKSQGLDKLGKVTAGETSYGRRTFLLDPKKTENLTSMEKVVLVEMGPSPFGGYVIDSTVVIYTD